MHHWWCNCRKSPGFTPSCRQGEGKGAASDPAAHFSCCLQSEMCSQNSSTEYAATSQPKAQASSALQEQSLLPFLPAWGGEGELQHPISALGITAGKVCVDHLHPEVASPESFTLQVAAAGSLIKATVLLALFPFLSCPFLQSWFFVCCFITAWSADPGLTPHLGQGPSPSGDKDCHLHWLGRGFHPCAHQ